MFDISVWTEINRLRELLSKDVKVPMSLLHTDPDGLTVSGGLLGFAYTNDAPQLFDSATGKLSLYFRGANEQFFAAYYDTKTARARTQLTAGEAQITFLARSAGSQMDGATITVGDGADASTCTVTIANSANGITETWNRVPRNPRQFAAVLNGQASEPVFVGKVGATSGTVTSLSLAEKTNRALEKGSLLAVGDIKVTTSAEVSRGAESIDINSAAVTAAAETAIYLIPYDYYTNATVNQPGYALQKGSLQFVVHPGTATDPVPNGTALGAGAAPSCQWVADAPGQAFDFDGDDFIAGDKVEQVDAAGDLSLEAWVKPTKVDGISRVIHHHSDNSDYTLGLKKQDLRSALEFDGADDYVEIPYQQALNPDQFTISCWVKVTSGQGSYRSPITSRDDSPIGGYILYAGEDNKWQAWIGDGSSYQTVVGPDVAMNQWTHVAATYDDSTLFLYVNGEQVGNLPTSFAANNNRPLRIGAGATERPANYLFNGQIDDVRIWDRARSADDIQADMNRRLSGTEPGSVGYWHFEGGRATDYSGNGADGTVHGNPQIVASPLNAYSVFTGVGNQFIKSTDAIPSGGWNHLAATFNQSYALKFDGEDYLDCGNNSTLDITQDLTLEVFLKVSSLGKEQGILTKGTLDDGTEQEVPYSLYIDADGKVVFEFEDGNGDNHPYKSSSSITANQFCKVAVTRKRGRDTVENKVVKDIQGEQIEVIESVDVNEWDDIRFYINDSAAGTHKYEGAFPTGHNGTLEIGRTSSSASFEGAISEVRIWNTAREPHEVNGVITGREQGLISWWRFNENEGNFTDDAKGGAHASIKGAQWVKTPDPQGCPFVLYRNGVPIDTESMAALDRGNAQFTLGAKVGGTIGDRFEGSMEEVRVWKVARTHEQLLDNLFTRLKGEKRDLLANYTFDEADEAELKDYSLLRNHLTFGTDGSKPNAILSTAPISSDTAQVRSALAGVNTPFHELIDSSPAVAEYGDMQYDSEGNLTGVFKRCYAYIQDGHWQLITGYKVGNLVREWIGQVQYDPQVIGFIEGVPPVPSENLTEGALDPGVYNYARIADISNIEFVESETVSYSLASSKEQSFDMGFSAAASFEAGSDELILIAPLGFGIAKQATESDFAVGLSGNFESSDSWSSEESLGISQNRSRSLSVALGAGWEGTDVAGQLNPAVGRRLVPGNMGFALVQSETADLFALRLAHNNALVSFRMQPNPDIPKDWNLIPFPMNPRYSKQGSLDGRVGYDANGAIVLDPDYANATGYGEYSYFKPTEAYALKQRIRREEQELLTYYSSFETEQARTRQMVGANASAAVDILKGAPGKALGDVESVVGGLIEGVTSNPKLYSKYAKRNLVNTYVWTADGGFFAETIETSDVKSETTSGSFSFSGGIGGGFSTDVEIFSIGFSLEFEAAIGGSLNLTKSRTKETENAFSIEVDVDTPGDLQGYTKDAEGNYQGDGRNVPGKVDAYRFMTFYLDSVKENFEDLFAKVVDPIWLEQSDHPNAVAMRQAQQVEKKPACWRVFHRVTFVSRILPEFESPTVPPLEKAMKAQNIESNWRLIKTLEPFVKNATDNFAQFTDAVHNALMTYLPELLPHEPEIIRYMALYFGINEAV